MYQQLHLSLSMKFENNNGTKSTVFRELPEMLSNNYNLQSQIDLKRDSPSFGINLDTSPLDLSIQNIKTATEPKNIPECKRLQQYEVISISSKESLPKTPTKTRKIKKKKQVLTEIKKEKKNKGNCKNNKPKTSDISPIKTPKPRKCKIKAKSEIKKNVNESSDDGSDFKTEKKPIIRKLTKSTNLKKISYKNHPPSQTRIENYFTKTSKTSTIGYFETFARSYLNETNVETYTSQNVNAYIDHLLDQIKIENCLEENNDNIYISNEKLKTEKGSTFDLKHSNEAEQSNCDENFSSAIAAASVIKNNENESTKSQTSFHTSSLKNQIQCNMSSEIFSLSETARIHKASSFQKSSESKTTMESEQIQPPKCKKARKRLSFKNCTSSMPQKFSEFDSFSFSTSKKSVKTKSCKTENSSKENFQPDNCAIIELSDEDNELILQNVYSDKANNNNICTTDKNINSKPNKLGKKRKSVACPSYKVVNGTTFAVDAFRFGYIEGITHYFLSHYHGDHYIGLKKGFSMPIFMSSVTARLVKEFIHVDSQYINVVDPKESVSVNGIEITAIDANHCPGAIMFAFKLQNGKVTLHTGDFRASFEMESNPYFWNNQVDTIYLDTTYLNNNYDFKSQSESIEDVRECVKNFQEKHIGKRILYICGSYVIGKEKVWAAIAEITGESVYTTGNRLKALRCIADLELIKHIANDPKTAGIHVLSVGELFYDKLFEYWKTYEENFDLILAIRPSGWERNSKPQYRGKINIVGIEYSEHSSYSELRRFIRFLQPRSIISTVPNGSDISKTSPIPINWLDNRLKPKLNAYQPSITNFTTSKKKYNKTKKLKSENAMCSKFSDSSRYEIFVSPIKRNKISSAKLKIS